MILVLVVADHSKRDIRLSKLTEFQFKFKFQNSKIKNCICPFSIENQLLERQNRQKLRKSSESNQSNINKSIRKIEFFHKLFFNEIFDGGTALGRHPSAQSSCCAHTTCLILFSSSSSIEALMSSFISKWLFLFWIVKLLSLTLLTWGNNREKRRYFLSGLIFVAKFCHFFRILINKETIEYS